MPQEHDREFRTEELPLAAFLCLEGHFFLRIEPLDSNPRIKSIIFRNSQRLIEDVECYESGAAAVEPVDFQKKVYWLRNKINPDGRRKRARS